MWVVDFLPTRTEAYIEDRDTGKYIYESFNVELKNDYDEIINFLSKQGVKVFNYNKFENTFCGKKTISYQGKGIINE